MKENCKSSKKAIGMAMVMSLVLTTSLPAAIARAASGDATIVEGEDSYETAAKVATTNWTSAKDVILVCGEGYADAVSATVLSKQLDAPILLTTSSVLNSNTKDALDKLKPQNIYVIGGTASVSQAVRNDLKDKNYNLIELSGKNRYETNIAVANYLIKLGVSAENVILVSGQGFSDVLSATPIAAAKGQIVLLGSNDIVDMKSVTDFVKTNNSKVIVIGTNNSINDDIYKSLGAINRVSGGANRFETNLNVLNAFDSDLKTDKIFIANASGDRYGDALIAASLAGKNKVPLVLVDNEGSSATDKAINYIKRKASDSTTLGIISEKGVVSDSLVSQINSSPSNGTTNSDSNTVKSVSTIGLNQIKVEFNTQVDEATAEQIKNYQIDGNSLGQTTETQGTATLQDDSRTVLITFSHPFQQYKDVTFAVSNTVLNKSTNNNISKYEGKITFSDVTPPTLQSVTARGGNKLIVKFSEPIRLSKGDLSSIKINRQSVSNFGLNTSQTVLTNQSDDWADGAELYFDSPLPIGSNILSIPNGDVGDKFDNAAGYPIKSSSMNFNIESANGTPKVISVTTNNLDTIYVKYDRAMDKQTALEDSNYKINGTTVMVDSSDISFDDGSNDTVVKIEDVGNLFNLDKENLITIKDNVQDTYSNTVNETNMNIYIGSDTAKPQVSSVSVLDGETMRIKFNKDVSNSYATNKGNYKIVDSDGIDITYKIESIGSVYIDGNSKRNFNIKFNDDATLKGSQYTVTIKNVIDTNSVPNVMDTYTTTVSGLDNRGAAVTEIVRRADDSQAVAIFFNKAMDESTLMDYSNYYFKDGTGETRKIPSSATITPSLDDKSVTIQFPSRFYIGVGSDDKDVVKMGVANVKDKSGNTLDTVAYLGDISIDSTGGPSLVSDTAKLTFDGDDIKVKISLTSPLDILNLNDFRVNSAIPDSGITVGNDVILTFKAGVKDNEKINVIRNAGSSTTVSIVNSNSVDAAGRKIKSGSNIVYIPPITVPGSWRVSSATGRNTVTIVFNQEIDDDIASSYNDDFIFKNERTGQNLNPVGITVDGRSIIYRFNNGSIVSGDSIDVHANTQASSINIRSIEHGNDGYTLYTPSKDDLKDRTIN